MTAAKNVSTNYTSACVPLPKILTRDEAAEKFSDARRVAPIRASI